MIKVFEEVDGDLYLDILLEEGDINDLQNEEIVEAEIRVAKNKTLHIGIKYFDEDGYAKAKRQK